ncbi:Uncharacterised protein [Serratia proteamaculans]|nr:Uncharacterised protein [Serratia proteamaculans]
MHDRIFINDSGSISAATLAKVMGDIADGKDKAALGRNNGPQRLRRPQNGLFAFVLRQTGVFLTTIVTGGGRDRRHLTGFDPGA